MLLRELISEAWSEKYKHSINCNNPKGFSQRAHCQGRKKEEDYDPNGPPPGPETKPTMPAGTVRVDVSDVYDWYKLGKNIPNLKNLSNKDFGKGPPSTIVSFGSEPEEHNYIAALKNLGLDTTDIDPVDPHQPKNMPRQKVDPTYNVGENFADGKNPQDKGDSARHGIPKHASISSLRKIAKQGGRKGQLAHWQANMRSGRQKANESVDSKFDFQIFKDFFPIAMKVLGIDKLPKINLVMQVDDDSQPTFGRFDNSELTIDLGMANRHPIDILRTLAHELVHFKQYLDDELGPNAGDTGSPQENQAHELAGVIMRYFNKQHRHYFHSRPLEIQEDATVGGTTAANVAVGAVYKNKQGKSAKNKDGTVKNALDMPNNLLTGGSLKR